MGGLGTGRWAAETSAGRFRALDQEWMSASQQSRRSWCRSVSGWVVIRRSASRMGTNGVSGAVEEPFFSCNRRSPSSVRAISCARKHGSPPLWQGLRTQPICLPPGLQNTEDGAAVLDGWAYGMDGGAITAMGVNKDTAKETSTMATLNRATKCFIAIAALLISHLVAAFLGAAYTYRLAREADEYSADASMLAAQMALEERDVETAMQWLVLAQVKAPHWYGPLVLSAKLYEEKGWPELSLQYLRRAEAVMSKNPEAEADRLWYPLIKPLGQEIDQRMDELEKQIGRIESAESKQ